MKHTLAIVAIVLAAGATIPAMAADRAPPPVPVRPGGGASLPPLGTVGGVTRPGDPNYRPGAAARPDRGIAPNRIGGVARPGDLGVEAPAPSSRAPAAGTGNHTDSRMLAPRQASPTARGRATGLGVDDPFAGAGSGTGGPASAQAPR
jgi:hypothetical protein